MMNGLKIQWVNKITLNTIYNFPINFTSTDSYTIIASEKNEGHMYALWMTDCTQSQFKIRSSSTMENTCSIFAIGY